MRNILSGVIISVMILLTLTGCEKDQNTLLTDGVWNFKNLTSDSEDPDVKSWVAWAKALFTDATLEFRTDDSYLITSPLLEEPIAGTWSLVGDDQLILEPYDENPSTANIETLSKKELSYIETYLDQNMDVYSITTTWTRD